MRIQEIDREVLKYGFNDTERKREYVRMKYFPRNENFVNGSVGVGVRLMVKGGGVVFPCEGVKGWHGIMMMISVNVE